jgi:protein required for attachment to host cells
MGKYSAARDLDLSRQKRWYLVANRAEARIYQDSPKHPFEFVMKLDNPDGRLTETELDSDRPGRGFASASHRKGIISHGLDKTAIRHESTAKRFASEIARILESGAHDDRFQDLVLVAEPRFLGLLRAVIPSTVKSRIGLEINREFAQGSDKELREFIQDKLEEARTGAA